MAIEVTTDDSRIDIDTVFAWLSASYWAGTRTRDEQALAMRHSINYGAMIDGRLVGFARLVTDFTTFAWLCDVIVDESCRGQGVGKAMMDAVFADPNNEGIRRWMLGTRDAHELYRKYGFIEMESGRIMRKGFVTIPPKPNK